MRAPARVGGARSQEQLDATVDVQRRARSPNRRSGGGWLAGIAMVLRSPYLAGIALWVSLLSLAGTFLYFQQANIVAAASDDPAVRTRIFATIDLAIGMLTIIVQFARHRAADRALRRRPARGVPAAGVRARLSRARARRRCSRW